MKKAFLLALLVVGCGGTVAPDAQAWKCRIPTSSGASADCDAVLSNGSSVSCDCPDACYVGGAEGACVLAK